MVFGLVSNRRRKPVPNTLPKTGLHGLNIEVYRYIVDPVADIEVQGVVHLLPHVGFKLVTF